MAPNTRRRSSFDSVAQDERRPSAVIPTYLRHSRHLPSFPRTRESRNAIVPPNTHRRSSFDSVAQDERLPSTVIPAYLRHSRERGNPGTRLWRQTPSAVHPSTQSLRTNGCRGRSSFDLAAQEEQVPWPYILRLSRSGRTAGYSRHSRERGNPGTRLWRQTPSAVHPSTQSLRTNGCLPRVFQY